MRYLGIDYGEKRVGLALSDSEGILGMPYKTISNKDLINSLKTIIKNENVEFVVVGLPLSLKMQSTSQTDKVVYFKKELEKSVGVPVEFENEFLTSVQAQKNGIEKGDIDASSAALILQSYLDSKKYKDKNS